MADQPSPHPSERDRVFNAETCRALRRAGNECWRVGAVIGTFGVFLVGTVAVGAMAWSPLAAMAVTGAIALLGGGAMVYVLRWVDLVPARKTVDAAIREVPRVAIHTLDWEHKLPPDSEYRWPPVADDYDPPAVPALAAGRAPSDWAFIVVLPLLVVYVVTLAERDVPHSVLLGGALALGVVVFWHTRDATKTYPPEDPPHEPA